MNLKIKKSHMFFVLIMFLLLQEFSVMLGSLVVPYYFFAVIAFVGYIFVCNRQLIIKQVRALYHTKIGKFFIFFLIWIILGIVSSIFFGNFLPKSFFTNFIGNFFCSHLFPFLIPIVVIPYFIGYKRLCKYLLIIYFIVFFAGVIEYIANTFNIVSIQNIFLFFVNKLSTKTGIERVFVEAYGRFRITGLAHGEPGALAAFTFVSCPIIYFLCTTKFQILKNKLFDKAIKISTISLAVFCFIGTQSPINLCFMLIFLGFVAFYKFLCAKRMQKITILVSFILILLLLFIKLMVSNVDLSETYLSRIINTVQSFTSMTTLVYVEPSLATRIGNYLAAFSIALKYPIFGIGYGNIMVAWPYEVLSLKVPITNELFYAAYNNLPTAVSTMFWKLSAETGFVGMILFYILLFNILLTAKKISYRFFGIERAFLDSLILSLILYISVSYYVFLQPFMWVYFGILTSMVLYSREFYLNIQNQNKIMNDKTEDNDGNNSVQK